MNGFLAMGGYAAYVWPAYGVVIAVMAGMGWVTVRTLRRREARLRELRGGREPR